MPATGIALLLLVISVALGVAAVVRRSPKLGVLTAASFGVFLVFTGLLLLVIRQM